MITREDAEELVTVNMNTIPIDDVYKKTVQIVEALRLTRHEYDKKECLDLGYFKKQGFKIIPVNENLEQQLSDKLQEGLMRIVKHNPY